MRTARLPRRHSLVAFVTLVALALCAGACTSGGGDGPTGAGTTVGATTGGTMAPGGAVDQTASSACTDVAPTGPDAETVAGIAERAASDNDLHAVLYRVTKGDTVVVAGALGESLPGEPATSAMHVRGGNVAFAYLGTLLLLMAESGEVRLDDPISRWLPDLDVPSADTVTLEMLTNNTSGYADYVREPAFQSAYLANPFTGFTPDELIDFSMITPPWYEPGTSWNYAHTNYQILGEALAVAGGRPLAELLTDRVIEPMGLQSTTPRPDTDMPEPVLQTYSSERSVYENTTWWNPSWQTAPGSVLATDICDLALSARAIGRGDLLTDASFEAQIAPDTASLSPAPGCPADVCRQMTESTYYGLGVLVMEGWVVQRPLFGGLGAVQAYLPAEDLSVAVVAVAGKDTEVGANMAQPIWISIAEALTPDAVPTV